ncbi:MAG TPA: SHOCT domain-containing protein [Candidatus Limnocylindria bacterium]|nr:SHOCT domain-containing protein [Candidatus Limnocylindria bacterium]
MGPGTMFMDPGMTGWMMASSLVFWLVLAAVAIFAIMRLGRQPDRRGGAETILDERLARGEIDVEEYRMRRAQLVSR